MGKEIGRQRFRLMKRLVLTPLAGPGSLWALSGTATRSKLAVLRRVVLPGLAAARKPFERALGDGLVFRANSQDFLPAVVLAFGTWEPVLTSFLHRRLGPGRVFVDVGANLGWFTIHAARWLGESGTVVAIEAAPDLFEELTHQVVLNRLENVRTINEAVGEGRGWVRIQPGPREHTGLTRVVAESGPGEGRLRAQSLPDMLTTDEIARCRAIKIDVEGAEYEVVRGMRPMLDRLPPDVEFIVEVGPARASSHLDVPKLFEAFAGNGFTAYEIPNSYSVKEWRDPQFPEGLKRITTLPTEECDVVFSRIDAPKLPF